MVSRLFAETLIDSTHFLTVFIHGFQIPILQKKLVPNEFPFKAFLDKFSIKWFIECEFFLVDKNLFHCLIKSCGILGRNYGSIDTILNDFIAAINVGYNAIEPHGSRLHYYIGEPFPIAGESKAITYGKKRPDIIDPTHCNQFIGL